MKNWVKKFAEGLISPVTNLISEAIVDKDKANELTSEIIKIVENNAYSLQRGQIDTNIQEAKHASIFVAGWRPAVGWICAGGIFWNYIFQPLLVWTMWIYDPNLFSETEEGLQNLPPELDIGDLIMLLTGMLGFGTLRTYEKTRGVARTSLDQGEKIYPWLRIKK